MPSTAASKLSAKYQVVIPREIRETMDLHEGQTIYIERVSNTELRLSTRSVIDRFGGQLGDLWGPDPMAWLKQQRAESDRFA
ncbi:MAG TPA: AbrB/MazE/SpoVT family DNA-binding domain-containing protein [Candidatus Saccharimonadia bacterium]|nr:AbrB/MazE/SpoVT family DNA-binding domain-containing protein [Candidatus Saccharimonadia bacterium]